jgi:restriction endonuclease Mrr
VRSIDLKIVLIDDGQLAKYMIDFGVRTQVMQKYDVKKIDDDFFSGE